MNIYINFQIGGQGNIQGEHNQVGNNTELKAQEFMALDEKGRSDYLKFLELTKKN